MLGDQDQKTSNLESKGEDVVANLMLQLRAAQQGSGVPSILDVLFNNAMQQQTQQTADKNSEQTASPPQSEPTTPRDNSHQQAVEFVARLLNEAQNPPPPPPQPESVINNLSAANLMSLLTQSFTPVNEQNDFAASFAAGHPVFDQFSEPKHARLSKRGSDVFNGMSRNFVDREGRPASKMPRLSAQTSVKHEQDLLEKLGLNSAFLQGNTNRSPPKSPENVNGASQTPHLQASAMVGAENAANMFSSLLPAMGLSSNFQLPMFSNNFASQLGNMNGEIDVARMAQLINGQAAPQQAAPKAQKRQYTSTSKNYCDLCNKEVCNKYFLRTHMLKMHNIVIDENKSVIANIDTFEKEKEGNLSFRCDMCKLRMDTRSELRNHKKEAHGIMPVTNCHPMVMNNNQGGRKTPSASGVMSSFSSDTPELPKLDVDNGGESSSVSPDSGSTSSADPCPACIGKIDADKLMAHILSVHAQDLSPATLEGVKIVEESVDDVALKFSSIPEETPSKEEKHSHTSGSASPVSVNIPEAYFQQFNGDTTKPTQNQTFVMRVIDGDANARDAFSEELLACIPLRRNITEPIKITIELRPTEASPPQPKE